MGPSGPSLLCGCFSLFILLLELTPEAVNSAVTSVVEKQRYRRRTLNMRIRPEEEEGFWACNIVGNCNNPHSIPWYILFPIPISYSHSQSGSSSRIPTSPVPSPLLSHSPVLVKLRWHLSPDPLPHPSPWPKIGIYLEL